VQGDAQGGRDYKSGADLPYPLDGGRPLLRGPAALAAAAVRRIAPWTRRTSGVGGSGGGGCGAVQVTVMTWKHVAAHCS
jgi:hypothetical protein